MKVSLVSSAQMAASVRAVELALSMAITVVTTTVAYMQVSNYVVRNFCSTLQVTVSAANMWVTCLL